MSERASEIIVLAGWPGCGKSTAGHWLASQLGYALIDRDTFMAPFVSRLLPDAHLDGDAYRPISEAAYEAAIELALENDRVGTGAVLVAPFGSQLRTGELQQLLPARTRSRVLICWLHAPLDTIRQRVEKRMSERDVHTLANWQQFCQAIDVDLRPKGTLLVDASGTAAQTAERILSALDTPPQH